MRPTGACGGPPGPCWCSSVAFLARAGDLARRNGRKMSAILFGVSPGCAPLIVLDEHADLGAERRHVADDRSELKVLRLASFELGDRRLGDPHDLRHLVLRKIPPLAHLDYVLLAA